MTTTRKRNSAATRAGIEIDISSRNLVSFLMLLLGLISLLSSMFVNSYILAFIGLGLTFWGALFLYIEPAKHVKLEIFNASSISTIMNIEKILANNNAGLLGVYLPPKRLQDYTSSLVYVPRKQDQALPTREETPPWKLRSKDPAGLLITPPGLALSKLFEKKLKKTFAETEFEDLQTQLPKLLDELRITKNLRIQEEGNLIIVKIRKHIFEDLCLETTRFERTHKTVGCILSSALACAFAKATGKPLAIEKEEIDSDRTTTIHYKMLED